MLDTRREPPAIQTPKSLGSQTGTLLKRGHEIVRRTDHQIPGHAWACIPVVR